MKLAELGYTVHGYDPAYEGTDPRIVKEYYSRDTVAQQSFGKADLIILRHVLEHISHPLPFLLSIAEANDYQGLLYIEVPDFRWIVAKNAFYDVFFEHCNYFTLPALRCLFSDVLDAGTFFGDQYCYVIARLDSLRPPEMHTISCLPHRLCSSQHVFLPGGLLSPPVPLWSWEQVRKEQPFCVRSIRYGRPFLLLLILIPKNRENTCQKPRTPSFPLKLCRGCRCPALLS